MRRRVSELFDDILSGASQGIVRRFASLNPAERRSLLEALQMVEAQAGGCAGMGAHVRETIHRMERLLNCSFLHFTFRLE